MVNKSKKSYIIVILLTLATAVASYAISNRAPRVNYSAKLADLPVQIGKWEGNDFEITKDVRKALNADEILSRAYVNHETGQELGLLMVYRKYGRRDFAHRPELCYPASGWEITKKAYTAMPYTGKQVQARLVSAEKQGRREVVVYWFASGQRTEANYGKQQLWMALDRLQDQPYGWAFIRLNVPVYYTEDEALNVARDFLKQADKPLLKVLTGKE